MCALSLGWPGRHPQSPSARQKEKVLPSSDSFCSLRSLNGLKCNVMTAHAEVPSSPVELFGKSLRVRGKKARKDVFLL